MNEFRELYKGDYSLLQTTPYSETQHYIHNLRKYCSYYFLNSMWVCIIYVYYIYSYKKLSNTFTFPTEYSIDDHHFFQSVS